ncbi:hypothetical protein BB561_001153 [Smittium simulii]|uniref:Uncharacterized protein n=1 Tax=Smittium simulii TaxID=133385 RepID=A0A2T9YVX8_9FUNG|nr:hypothetical protein BB561_001153 [Smittium simulii]
MNVTILLHGKNYNSSQSTPNKKAAGIDTIPIVDSAPKKDNLKYPNNYRGISSISTIVKLVSKIAENELSRIKQKYKRLVKEQASSMASTKNHYLAENINTYRAQVTTKPPLLSASISMRLVGKLLGEEFKFPSTRICKDPTILCVKTTLETAKFLNVIVLHRYLILNIIRL